MKKKITIIAHSFPPERGGAPARIYHLAQLLKMQGYNVEVLCSMPNYPLGKIFEAYKNKIISSENWEGIAVRRYWIYPSNSRNYWNRGTSMLSQFLSFGLFGFFRLLKNKPDILIVSSPPLLLGSIGTRLGKILNIKTLLNVSDLWPQTAVDMGSMNTGRSLDFFKTREEKMYRRADCFAGQSVAIGKHIAQFSNKPFFLYRNLPNINSEEIVPKNQAPRKIIYTGILGFAQGIFELIQNINFKNLGTELHIYGNGKEQKNIQQWLLQHTDSGVILHNSVDENTIHKIMLDFDAALIPLAVPIQGAVPSKIFATVALGLPILYVGTGEAATIIQDNQLGWVSAPKNWETLKNNINTYLNISEEALLVKKKHILKVATTLFNKTEQDNKFLSFLKAL